ncbi:MAG: RNA 2',3'-cyclic phosphodiesterase [Gammaproteobacteria bacterium]
MKESPSNSPLAASRPRGREKGAFPLADAVRKGEPEGDSSGATCHRRLFFALWPDVATRTAIGRATRQALRHAGGRPVAPENYHLTLAFLGEQPAALLPAIREAAAAFVPPRGELRLDRLGHFERARVLWLGSARTPPALRRTARALWEALAALDIARERHAFAAHLTLARKVDRLPAVPIRAVSWRYDGFALVESLTGAQESRYRVIARWPQTPGGTKAVE